MAFKELTQGIAANAYTYCNTIGNTKLIRSSYITRGDMRQPVDQ